MVIDNKEIIKPPKTNAGVRTIPIPKGLVGILKKMRNRYRENKLRFGKDFVDSGYVITKDNGEAYKPDGISIHYERFMYKMVDKGIPYKSLHKLRHTYATMLINEGANPKVVQKHLGHKDVTMTLDTYAHAYADRQREAVDKLDNVVFGIKSIVN